MKIQDLTNNSTFVFNVPFRIYQYIPSYDSNEEGEMLLRYDSETDLTYDFDLDEEEITAINMSDDNFIEIEFC